MRPNALFDAAQAYSACKNQDKASALASEALEITKAPSERSAALLRAMQILVDAGQLLRAERTASSVRDQYSRSLAQGAVAAALADAGDLPRAEQVARSIYLDKTRSQAFAHIAKALASQKRLREAKERADLCGPEDRLTAYADIVRSYQGFRS